MKRFLIGALLMFPFSAKAESCSLKVNGQCYQIPSGATFSIDTNGVFVNGKKVDQLSQKNITIQITGNVGELKSGSGNITISGNVGSIKSGSGNIEVRGNIDGNIRTGSGDVKAEEVKGLVKTGSGNIQCSRWLTPTN